MWCDFVTWQRGRESSLNFRSGERKGSMAKKKTMVRQVLRMLVCVNRDSWTTAEQRN